MKTKPFAMIMMKAMTMVMTVVLKMAGQMVMTSVLKMAGQKVFLKLHRTELSSYQ
nr:MAG TPA: hypothetical protein [Caudoviricetes sp.]